MHAAQHGRQWRVKMKGGRVNYIEIPDPAPFCPIPAHHPARATIGPEQTDVARTFREHSIVDLVDAYENSQPNQGANL